MWPRGAKVHRFRPELVESGPLSSELYHPIVSSSAKHWPKRSLARPNSPRNGRLRATIRWPQNQKGSQISTQAVRSRTSATGTNKNTHGTRGGVGNKVVTSCGDEIPKQAQQNTLLRAGLRTDAPRVHQSYGLAYIWVNIGQIWANIDQIWPLLA